MENILKEYAINKGNEKWENAIKREQELYNRPNDIRSEFERDYTRILHCTAYRRMKHKTQVFFSPESDHICTRSEHVALVESISYTIAKYLGLNLELTKAISIAHDIGHSPFGHQGEKILSEISKRDCGISFWHEKNGLNKVDNFELLEDYEKNRQNLNLTYAVRDGIISHCGEIDENGLRPRDENIDLNTYNYPNEYAPYTWEGCVVKIADKISYIGRDIEDAIDIGILDGKLEELYDLIGLERSEVINNTVIINLLITDLCENTTYEKGLCFSEKTFRLLNEIKKFNYKYIYLSDRLIPSNDYFRLVLNRIYDTLLIGFEKREKALKMYPEVFTDFENWLIDYWNKDRKEKNKNRVIFNIDNKEDYSKAIIYYISGMTDNYAIKVFNKIIGF